MAEHAYTRWLKKQHPKTRCLLAGAPALFALSVLAPCISTSYAMSGIVTCFVEDWEDDWKFQTRTIKFIWTEMKEMWHRDPQTDTLYNRQ